MIGYATVGTNDLQKSAAFFDKVLSPFKAARIADVGRLILFAAGDGGSFFAVCTPWDEKDPTPGNGTMIGLKCESPEQVQEVYKLAMENGATDEGEPGERLPDGGFYGAYFRDLDGNKFCAFKFG